MLILFPGHMQRDAIEGRPFPMASSACVVTTALPPSGILSIHCTKFHGTRNITEVNMDNFYDDGHYSSNSSVRERVR